MVLCLLGVMAAAGGLARAPMPRPASLRAGPRPTRPLSGATSMSSSSTASSIPSRPTSSARRSARPSADGAIALVVQLSSTAGRHLPEPASTPWPSGCRARRCPLPSGSARTAVGRTGRRTPCFGPHPSGAWRPASGWANAPPIAERCPRPTGRSTIGAGEALATKVATISAPTFGDFVVSLDGQTVDGTRPAHRRGGPGTEWRAAPAADGGHRLSGS